MAHDSTSCDKIVLETRALKDAANREDTASLTYLAKVCAKQLFELSQNEETHETITETGHGFWATRQLAEFNLWCANIRVHGEGLHSLDVRLMDVPKTCELLMNLLQSLKNDLNEIQSPLRDDVLITMANSLPDDADSDTSSLSFQSLSSSNKSEVEHPTGDTMVPIEERNLSLRLHVGDTIDRLQEHARQIQRAGAQHRRKRVNFYRDKERPKQVYEGFKRLGIWKVNETFELATEKIKGRTAESFARRRIRFEYLKEHQKKRALQKPSLKPHMTRTLDILPDEEDIQGSPALNKTAPRARNIASAPYPEDQQTLLSATVNTKFDFRPELKMKERAESVRSVALRNAGFPPPPRTQDGSFLCPYCRLEFSAREVEKTRWSRHVMRDFEPYFCTFEDCDSPFDVPNSFDGLLDHMQTHVPIRHHVEEPNGEHKEYHEMEFEDHVKSHGEISEDIMTTLKESSRRRGAFLFEECPFCGGYPDILEKRFPNPGTMEAQKELRNHVKQHMQEITLFLPPYRSDIVDKDDDPKGSDFAQRQSIQDDVSGNPDDFPTVCNRNDCDCKVPETIAAGAETDTGTTEQSWSELFGNTAMYNRSSVSNREKWDDYRLRPFIVHLVMQKLGEGDTSYKWFEERASGIDIQTPLLIVAVAGGIMREVIPILRQLISMGADLEIKDDDNHRTPLGWAACYGLSNVAVFLVENGANIDTQDENGWAPLHIAAEHGHVNVIRKLLTPPITANRAAKDKLGRYPLDLAEARGNHEALKLLQLDLTEFKAAIPKTVGEYAINLRKFAQDNLKGIFNPNDLAIKELAKKAVKKVPEVLEKWGLEEEDGLGLVKLMLYDFIILCGRSDLMPSW
ncbi:hypothetical protein GQ44DRAFT_85149 [Phaeosphaeriaceae sp. PMI808]|nr:hypothetical protein GQ44DRAFT_85149 [Phaeosphaeriaceae sp. PMI808]